jgi:hypothetical protein
MGYLAGSMAGGAIFLFGARLDAHSFAGSTGSQALNLYFHLFAQGRIHERNAQIIAIIRTFPGTGCPATPGSQPEKIFENVTEAGEDIFKTRKAGESCPAEAFMSKTIIKIALLWVAEDFVGLGSFFEFFLRRPVLWISIGMILKGQLPVSFLNLALRGIPCYTQNFIIVSFRHTDNGTPGKNINILYGIVKPDP